MVMHVPVKLGVLTITFERKPKRFIYQQGNAMYSTYAAQLISLFLLHPLKLKDSHCGEHMIFYQVSQPQPQLYFVPLASFSQNKVNWEPTFERLRVGRGSGRKSFIPLSLETHTVDSYCQKGENVDTWCDSPPLVPGYSLVVQGALLDPAKIQWSSAASTRDCICETAAAPMDARDNENIHPEYSSAWAPSVYRLERLDSTLWDFFTHFPSYMAEGICSLQLRGALLYISQEKESYAILA